MTDLLQINALEDGSCIGIFSPSEWLGDNRPSRVREGAEFLERQGFRTAFSRHYLAQDTIRAGTVGERIADINELLSRADIDALLATWGGKACNHLIYELPYERLREQRKAMIGFSDVAVLLNAITAKTGLVTVHGPNIAGKLEESTWSDLSALRSSFPWRSTNIIGTAAEAGGLALRGGRATGRLFGGNLNCFVLGVTMSRIDLSFFDGGIFFWEDIGLTPRQIDQFLSALRNVGFLDRISGMVVGDFFSEENHSWLRSDPLESVMHAIRGTSFPVVYAPIFGHRKLENPILPIGPKATLDADMLSLIVDEDVLRPASGRRT
jgi:muramoyltetrapeptide carboxypeptidase